MSFYREGPLTADIVDQWHSDQSKQLWWHFRDFFHFTKSSVKMNLLLKLNPLIFVE